VLTLVTALALTGLFTDLPETALAAIVVFAIRGMFDLGALARFRRLRPVEFRLALVALFGVLILDTLPGLVLAVLLSLLVLAFRASRPQVQVLGRLPPDGRFADVARQPDAVTVDGVLVARVEGGLWYANAQLVADRIAALEERSDPPCRVVILDLEETPELDITSLERLRQLAEHQHRAGRALLLARVHGQVIDQLRAEGGLLDAIDGVFPTVEAAMDQAIRITRPG
jgi:sulfate permease, SulP family